ncbi:hypothetical protein INT48_009890 [Thamnidium elegans]|uniref:Uncharacterized protein n=1 Tax=Thamnidium elegans TaxID=101142 RepID=A0A8H7SLC1_9FUNG|nr:hypothetical protein INT48_009890 [Thamnidium elegans]
MDAAISLQPPYDYFNFAEICHKDSTLTSTQYLTLINKELCFVSKKHKSLLQNAITVFQSRTNSTTNFYEYYHNYWRHRYEENNLINLQKRTREGLDETTSNVVGFMVATAKRVCL